jgi:hypothetical protein
LDEAAEACIVRARYSLGYSYAAALRAGLYALHDCIALAGRRGAG